MHPVSVLAFAIFLAGYFTARTRLVTRLYELAIFAWDHGVITRAAGGFAVLSIFFLILLIPLERIASREAELKQAYPRGNSYGAEAPSSHSRDGIMTSRNDGLLRIFWPSDAPQDTVPGVLVGWKNSELDVLVVGVLQGVDPRNVEQALRVRSLFRGSPHPVKHILKRCGNREVQVLGTLNTNKPTNSSDGPNAPKGPAAAAENEPVTLHQCRRDLVPRILSPQHASITTQVIVFDRPDPRKMQYLSLTPISLALGDQRGAFGSVPPFDRIDLEEEMERKRKQRLVEKLKLHSVVSRPKTAKELALPIIINQINCSAELNDLMQQNIGLVGVKLKRSLSVSERVVESANSIRDHLLQLLAQALVDHVWPVASQVFILGLMACRIGAELILWLLDGRLTARLPALKDVSATAQQVDIRLQQFCYWPAQYITLHRRRRDWESNSNSNPEYIRFFNSLWLVANDIIIGIALGSYILENAGLVAATIGSTVNSYSIEGLQRMILWLMDWPAGLKLNNELAKFLGDLFLWVIEYWSNCMVQLRPALPVIIRLIGISSFAGASLPIAMFSDLLSLLTLHIYSFYIASARIYNWQLTIIISLFHLFRGKKRNVLRNRIDSCDYDLDQLLLGTILFTLLFFLLPTVAVFYATFAGARIAIIALKAALDTWLACLNHFPLFALMLRVKDARRLPGGICFELHHTPPAVLPITSSTCEHDKPPAVPTSYVKLKSVPLPLSQTFSQYAQLGQRLRKHYLSPRVFLALVSGQFVPPIHRKNLYSLQYSMLPVQRVSISELWLLLTERKERDEAPWANANGHVRPAAPGKGRHGKAKTGGAGGWNR